MKNLKTEYKKPLKCIYKIVNLNYLNVKLYHQQEIKKKPVLKKNLHKKMNH